MATPTQWAKAVKDGRELWAKLQDRLAHPQDSDHGDLLVEEGYNVNWTHGGAWLPQKSEFRLYLDEDSNIANYSLARLQCKGTPHTPYQNAMNGEDGVIVCVYNFKKQDYTPEPSKMGWTAIIGQLWEQHAADPSNLSLICDTRLSMRKLKV
jgi:hypothetical protein